MLDAILSIAIQPPRDDQRGSGGVSPNPSPSSTWEKVKALEYVATKLGMFESKPT